MRGEAARRGLNTHSVVQEVWERKRGRKRKAVSRRDVWEEERKKERRKWVEDNRRGNKTGEERKEERR